MTADTAVCLVRDRSCGEQRLGAFERMLHRRQISVEQDDLQGWDFQAGAQDIEAVETGICSDPGRVDGKGFALRRLQEAPVAGVENQRLVAPGKFTVQTGQDLGALLGILERFFFVATENIAPLAEGHVLDGKAGLTFLPRNDERHRLTFNSPTFLSHLLISS